jgi:hypothetical protein
MDEAPAGMTQVLGGTRVDLDGSSVKENMLSVQGEAPRKCYQDLARSFGDIYDEFNTLAEQLASEKGNGGELAKLKAALPKLVAVQASNAARAHALGEFASTYVCTTEKSDFSEQLQLLTATALRRPDIGNDPHGAVQKFENAVAQGRATKEGRRGGGGGGGEDEDADLVITQAGGGGGGGYEPPNAKCPISGIAVGEIETPVEDEKGYIYEKLTIEEYINGHTRRTRETAVDCPQVRIGALPNPDPLSSSCFADCAQHKCGVEARLRPTVRPESHDCLLISISQTTLRSTSTLANSHY